MHAIFPKYLNSLSMERAIPCTFIFLRQYHYSAVRQHGFYPFYNKRKQMAESILHDKGYLENEAEKSPFSGRNVDELRKLLAEVLKKSSTRTYDDYKADIEKYDESAKRAYNEGFIKAFFIKDSEQKGRNDSANIEGIHIKSTFVRILTKAGEVLLILSITIIVFFGIIYCNFLHFT